MPSNSNFSQLNDADSFKEVYQEANRFIAGGVVSLNRKVHPHIIFKNGKGSRIYDINDKAYIDYHSAFAAHLLGHNNSEINEAVIAALNDNHSLIGSGTNQMEIKLAEMMCRLIPSLELIQITNTGSEGTAHAIRLSRAYTNKEHIILMIGGYNGWHNDVAREVMPLLAKLGPRKSADEYQFRPSSAGIPKSVMENVHCVNFNDLASVEYVMKKYPVACVLVEPVMQNIGVILPNPGYLQGLVDLCEQYGSVCIFDEVKTGFRSALGGYQHIAGVKPHLSVFGKAIANGYPLGVIGGKKEIMELFDTDDPTKRVLIAGTYNAHPFNVSAAIATLQILERPEVYHHLEAMSSLLSSGLENLFQEKGIPAVTNRNGSASCTYFLENKPQDLHDILNHHDFAFDLKYRKALIAEGIYLMPIACKQSSVSYAHSPDDIYRTLEANKKVLNAL
ncbi:aspartate aminotransferase family protein [Pedobacter foliorum]|uniref:aspartate aminotransferase family protein n=1 Tax=Pedobacter foliorum TaxID=2739058 RepID=UPI001564E682|nr:aspartate aminotransferase family protein [Pedobacter foliorum]NRF39599.1 aspartate aminotransferase family protein [Pedobacter foliorum]